MQLSDMHGAGGAYITHTFEYTTLITKLIGSVTL